LHYLFPELLQTLVLLLVFIVLLFLLVLVLIYLFLLVLVLIYLFLLLCFHLRLLHHPHISPFLLSFPQEEKKQQQP
jgi:cell division protein FtsW (lipid II flippase)